MKYFVILADCIIGNGESARAIGFEMSPDHNQAARSISARQTPYQKKHENKRSDPFFRGDAWRRCPGGGALALWQTYLRSSADKWRPGIAFSLKENSHYSAVMPLKPGTWNFHLDSPGGEISLGAGPRDAVAALGVDHALQWRGKDVKLKVERAGDYEFSLNLQNPDLPVIHIKRVEPAAVRISDGLQQ